ncbi:hypothetical protein Tco_1000336 [Tanacetum coccineum]
MEWINKYAAKSSRPLKDGFEHAGRKRQFLGLDGLKDSWKWFLDCLCDDLELFLRNSNLRTSIHLTWVEGAKAIAENFPNAEHRFCLKHIYDNMKLSWRGKFYKENDYRNVATASTMCQKFDKRMEEMEKSQLRSLGMLRARSHTTLG